MNNKKLQALVANGTVVFCKDSSAKPIEAPSNPDFQTQYEIQAVAYGKRGKAEVTRYCGTHKLEDLYKLMQKDTRFNRFLLIKPRNEIDSVFK